MTETAALPTLGEKLITTYVDFATFPELGQNAEGLIAVKNAAGKWALYDIQQDKLVTKFLYTKITPTRCKSALYLVLECNEFRGLFYLPGRTIAIGAAKYISIREATDSLWELVDAYRKCYIFCVSDHEILGGHTGYRSIEWRDDGVLIHTETACELLHPTLGTTLIPAYYVEITNRGNNWYQVKRAHGPEMLLYHLRHGEISNSAHRKEITMDHWSEVVGKDGNIIGYFHTELGIVSKPYRKLVPLSATEALAQSKDYSWEALPRL